MIIVPKYATLELSIFKEGDEIEMRIEGLGKISNKIKKIDSSHSLLKLKK